MNVIGIVAGPRRNGNTARLVEEIIAGADESGHKTNIFYLSEMSINPLEADADGYVYPEDDFNTLMPYLESMDALVLGTPIYYDHVSARTKILIDRLYYYSTSHGSEYRRLIHNDIKFVCVTSCGWDNPNVYDEVANWLEERMSHYWNMEPSGRIKAYGTGKNLVSKNEDLLTKARALGKSL